MTGTSSSTDQKLATGALVTVLLVGAAGGALVGDEVGLQVHPKARTVGAVLGSAPALGALVALAYAYTHKEQVSNWFKR
jgi:uncharacterized membrane protein YebE (DUF533 family)